MRQRKSTREERRNNFNKPKKQEETPPRPITEDDLNALLEHFGQKRAYPK